MNRLLSLPFAAAILTAAVPAMANEGPPPGQPRPPRVQPKPPAEADGVKSQLIIEARDDAAETGSVLLIPKSLMAEAKPGVGAVPGGAGGAGGGMPPVNMAVAGLAMSAAVVAGGLWLVRRTGPVRRGELAVGAAVAVAAVVLGGSMLWADVAPFPRPPRPPVVPPRPPVQPPVSSEPASDLPKVKLPPAVLSGPVTVRFTDDKEIKLIVSRKMLAMLVSDGKPEGKAPEGGKIPVEK
jgi:hypothetical protein